MGAPGVVVRMSVCRSVGGIKILKGVGVEVGTPGVVVRASVCVSMGGIMIIRWCECMCTRLFSNYRSRH